MIRTAIDRLSTIRKPNLFNKIKPVFFRAVVGSVLLYSRTTLYNHTVEILGKNRNLQVNDATNCFEQILEDIPYKTALVWPPASHLINHPNTRNKMCSVLLENKERTHKWLSSTDSDTSADAGCCLENLPRAMIDRDGGRVKLSIGIVLN